MASTIAAITTGVGGVVTTADATGNLSLLSGTTTVVAVTSTGASVTGTLSASGVSTFAAGTALLPALTTTGDTNTGVWFPAADTIAASTGGTERMRIDSGGTVLVGNSTNASSQATKLYSYQSAVTGGPACIVCDKSAAGTIGSNQILFVNSNGVVGSIVTTGSATSYVTSSDYRLKENIVLMTGALNKVAKLKPVTYTWKVDGSSSEGFIAHELQAIVPDCVTGEKDAVDEEGNIKPQGIDTSFLVATLTAAIQEQQTIINDLKARITALEGLSA